MVQEFGCRKLTVYATMRYNAAAVFTYFITVSEALCEKSARELSAQALSDRSTLKPPAALVMLTFTQLPLLITKRRNEKPIEWASNLPMTATNICWKTLPLRSSMSA